VDISITLEREAYEATLFQRSGAGAGANEWKEHASGRRICVDSSDGSRDPSRKLLRVVE